MSQRHIIVVGGTRGLGLELARAAVARGDRVTVAGRDEAHAKEQARLLGSAASGASCDLTDWPTLARLFSSVESIDHLVLAALDRDHNDIADFRPDDSARTSLMKNVGYAAAVHHALRKFTSDASVLLFSGLSMWRPMPGSTTISMANAGIIGLMNSLTVQIAPVRVNTITPGLVTGTNAVDEADPVRAEAYERQRRKTPGGRLPHREDIVHAAFGSWTTPGSTGRT